MSNFNKVVTNLQQSLSNTENDNLSQTLSAVRTAGGGGGGGTSYGGDGTYIEIVGNNTITLTTTAAAQLNRAIPTTVAELTDSADYATKDFADAKYQPKVDMSAYLTTANAASTYQTIDGMNDYVGQQEYNDFKNTTNSNFNTKQNKLNFGYDENNAISSIDGHKLAGAGGVTGDYYSASNPSGFITSSVNELDNFYSKSQTSGAEEIANAIKDFVDTDLLETTSGALKTWVSTNYYDKTDTSSKTEIENAFDNIPKYILNGDSNITAQSAQDGKNIRWDLSVNATPVVTDTTLTGDKGIYTHTTTKSGEWCVELVQSAYAAINDVQNKLDTSVAAQTYQPIGNYLSSNALEGYATTALLDTISSKIESDIPTTVAQLTDSANYYKKSETSGATELSTEFGKYALKSEIPTVPTKVSDLTDSANYYKTTETSSKNELSTEFAKYQPTGYYATSAGLTAGNQYAMTTTGWEVVQAGSTFTGVTTTGSISGGGVNNDTIGLLTSAENALTAVANKVDKPDTTQTSLSNKYLVYSTLTGTGEVTGWTDFNANVYSKTESDGRYVATADVGSGLYYSGSSPKLGVKLGTDLAFNATTSAIQINTNGTATGTYAFVEGESNTANGNASHAEGFTNNIINSYSHGEGRNNTEFGGNTNHLEGGYNKVNSPENGGYVHIEGEGNEVTGHSIHMEGAFNIFNSTSTANRGISIEGYANSTTANDTSVHSGILKVIGNGERINSTTINRSDAYILYRDGTVSAKQFQNADGTETINGTTYNFSGVDNIEILPNAATANTANFPNDNVLRFILES